MKEDAILALEMAVVEEDVKSIDNDDIPDIISEIAEEYGVCKEALRELLPAIIDSYNRCN